MPLYYYHNGIKSVTYYSSTSHINASWAIAKLGLQTPSGIRYVGLYDPANSSVPAGAKSNLRVKHPSYSQPLGVAVYCRYVSTSLTLSSTDDTLRTLFPSNALNAYISSIYTLSGSTGGSSGGGGGGGMARTGLFNASKGTASGGGGRGGGRRSTSTLRNGETHSINRSIANPSLLKYRRTIGSGSSNPTTNPSGGAKKYGDTGTRGTIIAGTGDSSLASTGRQTTVVLNYNGSNIEVKATGAPTNNSSSGGSRAEFSHSGGTFKSGLGGYAVPAGNAGGAGSIRMNYDQGNAGGSGGSARDGASGGNGGVGFAGETNSETNSKTTNGGSGTRMSSSTLNVGNGSATIYFQYYLAGS